jgi:hypothetical protein
VRKRQHPPPPYDGIDETYLLEWVDFGLAELASYLLKVALYERWCHRNGRTP